MTAAQQLGQIVGRAAACRALAIPRASLYRNLRPAEASDTPGPRPTPPRALAPAERQTVLDHLHAERFRDKAPAEIFATLLDEGTYLCSVRTLYRILEEEGEVRERRDQTRHPNYQKPELLATGPNQVWSWDITKLLGPAKWTYFYLYVILDIFSRYVAGWMVAYRETAELAKRLLAETCQKQGIAPGQLTVHADRGSSMTSKPVAFLLSDLGVTKTHSRPHVSDDNPFSESQFKTLKYRPEFPDRFGSIQDARGFCQVFFPWYNTEHHHSGIGLLTPEVLHYGRAEEVVQRRQQVLSQAYERNPERFVRLPPRPPAQPTAVWINPPVPKPATEGEQH
jgi:putative transposase